MNSWHCQPYKASSNVQPCVLLCLLYSSTENIIQHAATAMKDSLEPSQKNRGYHNQTSFLQIYILF